MFEGRKGGVEYVNTGIRMGNYDVTRGHTMNKPIFSGIDFYCLEQKTIQDDGGWGGESLGGKGKTENWLSSKSSHILQKIARIGKAILRTSS